LAGKIPDGRVEDGRHFVDLDEYDSAHHLGWQLLERIASYRRAVCGDQGSDCGYWHFLANSREEAAALAAQNPCLACGLSLEIRPIEPKTCSAFDRTTETPHSWRK
jgi:hypothetical protein